MFNQFEGRSIDDVIKGTVHTAHSQEFVVCFFYFVSCETSQNVNILQLPTYMK